MKFLKDCLKGVAIGAGAILPGISSGVLCVVLGIYEKLLDEFANLDFEIYYITLYLENENEYVERLKRDGKAVFKGAEFKAENSKKQQKIYLEMADEIKEKYPNVNVLNVANDKDLEDTKKEIREFIQY